MSRGLGLYVDCARMDAAVALWRGAGETVAELAVPHHPDDRRGRLLFQTIEALLHGAGATLADLSVVAAGVGPGPMSGTRVGIAAAQGLGTALGLPAVGLPAWFGVADPERDGPQDVVVGLDRLGAAYATVHVAPDGWRLDSVRLGPPIAAAPAIATAAMLRAAAAAAPGLPSALEPIYLRQPDVRPQQDALGRPLDHGCAP